MPVSPFSSRSRAGVVLAIGLIALLASACGAGHTAAAPSTTGSSGTPSASASTTPTPSPTPTPSASTSSSATAAPTATGPTACRSAGISVSLADGGGAAGSFYTDVILTNTGSASCVIRGYGGISYVKGSNGAQVGAPAERDHSVPVRTVLLAPGQRAMAVLQEGDALNYPEGTCKPTPVRGLRIYPPNETHSLYVAHRATACANAKVVTMDLQPYRKH